MKTTMIAAVMAVLMGTPALAAGVDRRADRQQARIAQGIQSGELTAREAAKLERKEARLGRTIERQREDGGGLSAGERARIQRQENRLSREIYRQKHDGQSR